LLLITLWIAVRYASSPVELISEPGNSRLVSVLRARVGANGSQYSAVSIQPLTNFEHESDLVEVTKPKR